MNFLAHAYLSFKQSDLLVGNLISDFVKGRKRFDYPAAVQQGIALHRAIDQFTDEHRINAEARKIFRGSVGLYAGAFLDVVYDHFLAKDAVAFPGKGLPDFSQWVYKEMEQRLDICPPGFVAIFPYMKSHDWLLHYQEMEGMERSFEGLVRRAKYIDDYRPAWEAFQSEYVALKGYYEYFFPELLLFASDYLQKHLLLNQLPKQQ